MSVTWFWPRRSKFLPECCPLSSCSTSLFSALLLPCFCPAPALLLVLPTPVWQPSSSSSAPYDFFRHGDSRLLWYEISFISKFSKLLLCWGVGVLLCPYRPFADAINISSYFHSNYHAHIESRYGLAIALFDIPSIHPWRGLRDWKTEVWSFDLSWLETPFVPRAPSANASWGTLNLTCFHGHIISKRIVLESPRLVSFWSSLNFLSFNLLYNWIYG